jgi:mono/diheme cytochrome c family protein
MKQHNENPDLLPPETVHTDALKPDAPDFVETPDVEPLSQERESLPVWLYIVCGFALFMAGSSFTGFEIFGQGLLDQGPGGPTLASSSTSEAAEVTDPLVLGKKVYNNNCANCHHADGMGQPGVYPPMGGSALVVGSKERLAAVLLQGLSGPVTVNGGSYGSAVMPAWGSALTDDKIANVMTYIRGSFGNKANAASEDEVTKARATFTSHAAAFTQAELLKIAPDGPDPSDKK